MKVTGSATLAAPPARVWNALQDPAVLVRTIPGCRRMEQIGADCYAVTIDAGVASIKGTYVGEVALSEPDPPHSFVLRAHGQGASGTVDATVTVRLAGHSGDTRIDYDAEAVVGGMIGGVGQRVLAGVARRTAGEFFTAVGRLLTEPARDGAAPSNGAAVDGAASDGVAVHGVAAVGSARGAHDGHSAPDRAVYVAPPAADKPASVAWAMASAFSAGGAIALAGVAIGYLMGRRARR